MYGAVRVLTASIRRLREMMRSAGVPHNLRSDALVLQPALRGLGLGRYLYVQATRGKCLFLETRLTFVTGSG